MSEKDNFAGGFLLGTLVGGILGGIIGTVLAGKNNSSSEGNESDSFLKSPSKSSFNYPESIEATRLSLEEKINQLNHAIDDVRVTLLKNVNDHEKNAVQE
jgi:gas vesicle protein